MNQTLPRADVSPAASSPARIKGSHLRPFFDWYTSKAGQERTGALLNKVPTEYQTLFDAENPHLGILDSSWYPAPAIHALLDAAMHGIPAADRTRFAQEGARVATQATLRGVYRWLFEMMMTPDRYARKAQVLVSRFYEPGVLTKTETAPHTHLTILSGWTGHHPYLCEMLFYSGLNVYETMGCRNVRGERLQCVSDGAPDCRHTARWDPPGRG